MCLESLKHALLDTISRLDHQHNFFCSAGWSLFRGRSFYKTLVSLVDPPYFQRAQREKMARSLSQACANESSDLNKSLNAACASQKKESSTYGHESTGVDVEHATTIDSESNRNDMNMRTHDESECLSDIDDLEIDLYLHNEEERRYKKIIWEKLNRDYLKEQTAKEAAAKRGFDGLLASRELGTAFAAKSQKGKKKGQAAKSSGSVQLGPKAALSLGKKRLSSKVNFEMVEKLFDEPEALENPKKARFDPCSENHDDLESELENKNRGDDELESTGEFEEETDDLGGLYENTRYDNIVDEGSNYEDDDYNFE
ncbi:transcription factor IIIB 70 kDa subunit-like isoform X2 [Prosopis cineraria]|uniref:transcription factor IIIB 70 kDa subunit-like isoform X2 n=1 Tax=Prosopis cineraria TaxID=364024 RepID=UPI00240EBFA6|nr:transcription factor IIIB 70 kDa subunit-like isoform X2 [Prosopis cineraria]